MTEHRNVDETGDEAEPEYRETGDDRMATEDERGEVEAGSEANTEGEPTGEDGAE